jgi:hypothetical protein
MSVRPDNEASNHGVRLLLYSELPGGNERAAQPQPRDMAGGAQRVRRHEAAQNRLSAKPVCS